MNRPINKQDEFLLSRLLDGDLPDEQAEALRERMQREPELGRVYAQLAKVDKLLAEQRSDQPAVKWDTFRREIMDQVHRQGTRNRLIRLSNWLRAGAPLAAAASIALGVLVYLHRPAPESPAGRGTIEVAYHEPAREQKARSPKDNELLVVFNRPSSASDVVQQPDRTEPLAAQNARTPEIKVTFQKSEKLSEQYRQRDQMLRSEPSIQYHVTTPSTVPPATDELFDSIEPLG